MSICRLVMIESVIVSLIGGLLGIGGALAILAVSGMTVGMYTL
jgi:hypothetical protein